MTDEVDALRTAISDAESASEKLRKRRELVRKLEARVKLYRERLASEQADVDRLEGPGLAAFVRGLLANREGEIEREKRELAVAAVLLDEARAALADARAGLAELIAVVRDPAPLRARLEQTLRERAKTPGGLEPDEAQELRRIELRSQRKELIEADMAAGGAVTALDAVLVELASASTLGTVDMIGGGMLISSWKHAKIGAARSRLATAQGRLRQLARELEDLRVEPVTALEMEPLTRFADVFLDNLFTDWLVQTRIQRTSEQVRDTKRQVSELQVGLRARLRRVEQELRADDRSDG